MTAADDGFGHAPRRWVRAVGIETGAERWSIPSDLSVSRAPLVTSAGIVVMTDDLEISCD